jgi:hypothetical protein
MAKSEEIIATRKFVIEASSDRVWSLMGRVIFGSLPLESMQLIDENNFTALLRVPILSTSIAMRLRGQIVADSSHPGSLSVLLIARKARGLIRLDQKVTLATMPAGEGKTEVVCESIAQGMSIAFRVFLLGKAKRMARSTLESIERRFKSIA